MFVNSVVICEYVYVKLAEPLSADIDVDFKCWLVEEQKDAYIDRVSISAKSFAKQYTTLSNPNWQANSTINLSSESKLIVPAEENPIAFFPNKNIESSLELRITLPEFIIIWFPR